MYTAIKFIELEKQLSFFMSPTQTFRKIIFFLEQINQPSNLCLIVSKLEMIAQVYVTLENLVQYFNYI